MEGRAMDKDMLSRWERVASNVCKLDDAREAEIKHKGLCNLQKQIHNEMGAVLDTCVVEAVESNISKISFAQYSDFYWWERYNGVARTCVDLLVNHLSEVKEWEADDDEMRGKRLEKLKRFRQVVSSWRWSNGKRVYEPDNIYCEHGLYRQFANVCYTCQYKIVKALQAHNVSNDDLETYYKAVGLYISLSNEKAEVEAVAGALGVSLQEPTQSKPDLPQREPQPKGGATIHPEQESAPDVKLQRFLECVPTQSKKKAKSLLQRVIKAGYCTANYEWVASRWKSKKSRLALACFCYLASDYLGLSERVDAGGKPTTNWKPFERLFEYDGKNQLMNTKKSYMRTNTNFNPPELREIKTLFL